MTEYGIHRVKFLFLLVLMFALRTAWANPPLPPAPRQPHPNVSAEQLQRQAEQSSPERARYARSQQVKWLQTADGRSFSLLWLPPGAEAATTPIIVTLHGHGSWAHDEFFLWHQAAARRGYGILALQWWFGQGEQLQDYYLPQELNRIIDDTLRELKVGQKRVLLHGFSRGSANIYGVTAFDARAGRHVALTVANAGKATADFPVNQDIASGRLGSQPLAGTQWWMYCGGRDAHPERDGCQGMREAREWVSRYGGNVIELREDVEGDHGGFHRRKANVEAALDSFAGVLGRH